MWTLTKIVAIVVPLMLCVAYLTLAERKVIGWMQVRLGPNRVTFFGIRWLGGWAQPIADGLKLLIKEIIIREGRPLTDREIVSRLRDEGIRVARRTVAKYRSQLGILPSTLR